jgi:hypothetical protein
MRLPLYQAIARRLVAKANCVARKNHEWQPIHDAAAKQLTREHMPSGSGIDTGTVLGDDSTASKLIFRLSFHHMNEGGFYDGWTDHSVIVTPSLAFGFDLKVTGQNRNDIKDYLAETFQHALLQTVEA